MLTCNVCFFVRLFLDESAQVEDATGHIVVVGVELYGNGRFATCQFGWDVQFLIVERLLHIRHGHSMVDGCQPTPVYLYVKESCSAIILAEADSQSHGAIGQTFHLVHEETAVDAMAPW